MSYADRYSHPDELISLLKANLPKGNLEPMLIADNAAPRTVVQVNTLRISAEELAERLTAEHVCVKPHEWMADCLVLSGTGSLEQLPAFREGLFYVQDPAAKLSILCAGRRNPAGTCWTAAPRREARASPPPIAMGGKGSIVSCDIYPHKTALIENGAARLGLTNITARQQDASQTVPEWVGAMDTVIADVPCSGLGIIRKKPDIRYKNLKELEDLPALQLKILETQASYVRPGGTLLYSTCTVLKRENEDVVSAFLAAHGGFTTEPLPLPGCISQKRNRDAHPDPRRV